MKTPASLNTGPRLSHIILSLIATGGFLMADAASRIDVINAAEVENIVLQRTMAEVGTNSSIAPAQPVLVPLQHQASLVLP